MCEREKICENYSFVAIKSNAKFGILKLCQLRQTIQVKMGQASPL